MKLRDFQNFSEKFGFLLSEPVVVEGGISKKTGKAFETFCYFKMLEYGAEDSTTVYVAKDSIAKIQTATENMPYLQSINVAGISDASGKFSANDVIEYSFDDMN